MIELEYPAAVGAMFVAARNSLAGVQGQAIAGYVPEVRFYGNEKATKPDGSKFWALISQRTAEERQSTLSNCAGVVGQKRFTVRGLITVQLYCPKSNPQGMAKGRELAILARNAFRGQLLAGSIWFRNARIAELDPESDSYRLNVMAEYEYDELG